MTESFTDTSGVRWDVTFGGNAVVVAQFDPDGGDDDIAVVIVPAADADTLARLIAAAGAKAMRGVNAGANGGCPPNSPPARGRRVQPYSLTGDETMDHDAYRDGLGRVFSSGIFDDSDAVDSGLRAWCVEWLPIGADLGSDDVQWRFHPTVEAAIAHAGEVHGRGGVDVFVWLAGFKFAELAGQGPGHQGYWEHVGADLWRFPAELDAIRAGGEYKG